MESLYLLIPIGIIFIVIAVKILFWAINNGQYDNLDTEAYRILFDEQEHLKDEPADHNDDVDNTKVQRPDRPASDDPDRAKPHD